MLMVLPQYLVTFFPGDSRRIVDQIQLVCSEDEVKAIVPVLLRSGYVDFQVRLHDPVASQENQL